VEGFAAAQVLLLSAGDTVALRVEVAETERQHRVGLSRRSVLPEDAGMLFLFPGDQPAGTAFWMYRTPLPLSVALLDSAMVIREIRDLEPCRSRISLLCPRYEAGVPFRAALEVNRGLFERRGIAPGARVIVARSGSPESSCFAAAAGASCALRPRRPARRGSRTGGAAMPEQPFWEAAPSDEVVSLATRLQPGGSALDLGCGEGRNALYLASLGMQVVAVDPSEAGIRRLRRRARDRGLRIDAHVADLRTYAVFGQFDLIVANGVLHLLEPVYRNALLQRMYGHTRPGGYNVVAALTDALPPPPELAPYAKGLFQEGELFQRYARWDILRMQSCVLEAGRPGGVRHRHPVEKVVARRPELHRA